MLCNYRQSFRNSGAKDDRTDAKLLESYLRCHHAELRPIEPDTELTRKLAGLVEIRRGMVGHRTDLVNELHSILKTYFHLMEVLFEDLTLPVASDFLLKWPDLDSAQKAGDKALRKFFYGHNCRGDKKLDRRLEAIKKALPLTKDPAIIEPAAIKARFLASLLAPAHRSIAEIDEKIKEATDAHPDAPIFRSFPCAGPAMVPRLLVAFGTNRDRFDSATEVQQYYGIAPVRKQSGKSSVVHLRHRCPKFGRQTFHENAGHAVRPEGWAKAFYEQLRANEKGHHAAVRTVAFKLIRIYFRCWKDRQPYDPGKYEAALQKHGSPLTKSLQPKTQKLQ